MNSSFIERIDTEPKPALVVLSCSDTLLGEALDSDKLDAFAFIPLTASKHHLLEIKNELIKNKIKLQFTTLTGDLTKEQMDIVTKMDCNNTALPQEIIESKFDITNNLHSQDNSDFLNILPISKVNCCDFSGIIFPHHLGALQDLYNSDQLGTLIREFYETKKPICAIGYGVWGLCAPEILQNGTSFQNLKPKSWCLTGAQITGISQNEEFRQPYFGILPTVLQDLIEEKGGDFVQFEPDETSCVIDRNLITGPNEISTILCLHNFCWLCSMT